MIVLVVLVAAYSLVTVRFFVVPPTGVVRDPQAVAVLNGYRAGTRVERGMAIARRDHVHNLVLSVSYAGAPCPTSTASLKVICFVPDPSSTQGEARAIARIARNAGWRRLVVVSGTTQVVRAGLRIGRCYSGQVSFSGVDPSGITGWAREVLYDEAAMVKALVWQWGC